MSEAVELLTDQKLMVIDAMNQLVTFGSIFEVDGGCQLAHFWEGS